MSPRPAPEPAAVGTTPLGVPTLSMLRADPGLGLRWVYLVGGMVFVAVELTIGLGGARPLWTTVLGYVGLVAWAVLSVLPARRRRTRGVLRAVAVVAAGLAGPFTAVLATVPGIVVVSQTLRQLDRPLRNGVGLLLTAVALTLATLLVGAEPAVVLGCLAAYAIGSLVGMTRRQSLRAQEQERLLLAERVAAQQEQARAEILAERSAIARDIHDVLAHSLGGLVIQLDAADALLEAGRAEEAAGRVRDARALAADGLGEARRAVAALREGADVVAVSGRDLVRDLHRLAAAHERLGERITLTVRREPVEVSGPVAAALVRALQEALSNARKHAPGVRVDATLDLTGDILVLDVRTPLLDPERARADLAGSGGGHGLAGMAERFRALPDGRLEHGPHEGCFVVRAAARAGAGRRAS